MPGLLPNNRYCTDVKISSDKKSSIIVLIGWSGGLPCSARPRAFPVLSVQTAPGFENQFRMKNIEVGSTNPGDWLDAFAMLTECTDAKFCNTTAQVPKAIGSSKPNVWQLWIPWNIFFQGHKIGNWSNTYINFKVRSILDGMLILFA